MEEHESISLIHNVPSNHIVPGKSALIRKSMSTDEFLNDLQRLRERSDKLQVSRGRNWTLFRKPREGEDNANAILFSSQKVAPLTCEQNGANKKCSANSPGDLVREPGPRLREKSTTPKKRDQHAAHDYAERRTPRVCMSTDEFLNDLQRLRERSDKLQNEIKKLEERIDQKQQEFLGSLNYPEVFQVKKPREGEDNANAILFSSQKVAPLTCEQNGANKKCSANSPGDLVREPGPRLREKSTTPKKRDQHAAHDYAERRTPRVCVKSAGARERNTIYGFTGAAFIKAKGLPKHQAVKTKVRRPMKANVTTSMRTKPKHQAAPIKTEAGAPMRPNVTTPMKIESSSRGKPKE
ncbi:hypothetical protein KIN20_031425 [Parelaphostrongylus tenuis]|uniref:Uncharacterized protein n=1 Tax=Parelaphostrongylus tenuis TaxID=148309 RepID=A0AAD5WH78_PARTN|nr:hypothetical protein KIN20_031425 [Parelaphostrongylus tenuis]